MTNKLNEIYNLPCSKPSKKQAFTLLKELIKSVDTDGQETRFNQLLRFFDAPQPKEVHQVFAWVSNIVNKNNPLPYQSHIHVIDGSAIATDGGMMMRGATCAKNGTYDKTANRVGDNVRTPDFNSVIPSESTLVSATLGNTIVTDTTPYLIELKTDRDTYYISKYYYDIVASCKVLSIQTSSTCAYIKTALGDAVIMHTYNK